MRDAERIAKVVKRRGRYGGTDKGGCQQHLQHKRIGRQDGEKNAQG